MNHAQFSAAVLDLMEEHQKVQVVRGLAVQAAAEILETASDCGICPIAVPMSDQGVKKKELVEAFLMSIRPSHDAHDYLDDEWNFIWEHAWPEGLTDVLFGPDSADSCWAAELFAQVERIAEDIGLPEPPWFEAEDFEPFIASWRKKFFIELHRLQVASELAQEKKLSFTGP